MARRLITLVLGLLTLIGTLTGTRPAHGLIVHPVWTTNGSVYTSLKVNNTIYLGGRFSYIGPATGAFVPINAGGPLAGKRDPNWPDVAGEVYASAPDGSGGWFIGGAFTHVGGQARQNLAHIRADQKLDPNWTASANSTVWAMVSDPYRGWVWVGGAFTEISGTPRERLAALDSTTGAVRVSFNTPVNSVVWALAYDATHQPSGHLFVGGNFTLIGGAARTGLAGLDARNGSVEYWHPNVGDGYGVYALAIDTSAKRLYAGGAFNTAGGQTRVNLAAFAIDDLSTDGNALPWRADTDNFVTSLLFSGNRVYAGGTFATVGGQPRAAIAAIDGTTGAVTAWNPGMAEGMGFTGVYALTVNSDGSTIYAGGNFQKVAGQARRNLVAISAATGAIGTWDPGASDSVYTLQTWPGPNGGMVFAGGSFVSVNGFTRSHLAAIDATTGAGVAWGPRVGNAVFSLERDAGGGTIYAGGEFLTVDDQSRGRLAAFDAMTGALLPWNPDANSRVFSLWRGNTPATTDTLYVGGNFTSFGTQTGNAPRTRLAAFDLTNGTLTAWNPGADAQTYTFAQDGDTLYLGGEFTQVGGQPRSRLAALSATTGGLAAWAPVVEGPVYMLAISGGQLGQLYAGGRFARLNGQTRGNGAAFALPGGALQPWDPGANDSVGALLVEGNIVYTGGLFTEIGGQTRNGLAALDAQNGAVLPFDLMPDRPTAVFLRDGSRLYIGGDFTQTDGRARHGWFAYSATLPPDTFGVYRPTNSVFYLRNSNNTGPADLAFRFGDPGDVPVSGDWDGDDVDTVGVYRPSAARFYLSSANAAGAPLAYTFNFGVPGDTPLSGDWDGDGRDGIGVQRNGQFHLRSQLATGNPDLVIRLGDPGDVPVAGDWDGNGVDSPGVYKAAVARFGLTDQLCNCTAMAHYAFAFGQAGDVPLAGDWDGDGAAGIGVFRAGRVFLKNAPATGYADLDFVFGLAGDRPLAGRWASPPAQPSGLTAPIFEPHKP